MSANWFCYCWHCLMDDGLVRRRPQKVLPFLKLPGEIRNRIYEFVLQNDAQPVKLKLKLGFPTPNKPKQSRYAALTRVCRQIRFECRPLQLQVQNVSSVKLCMSYNTFAKDPLCRAFRDCNTPSRNLAICFLESSEVCDTSVNLLPLLWDNANPNVHFSCTIEKNGYVPQKMFEVFLLLSRLFRHDDEDWVSLYKSCALDAVIFKLDGTHLEIGLKHNKVGDLDVDNKREVEWFLHTRSILGCGWGSNVRRISGIKVIVTRCPAPGSSSG